MSRASSGLHPQKENQSSWFSKMESRLLGVPSGLGWLIGKAYNPLSHFVWRMDQSWTLLLGGTTFQNIPREREQHASIFCANASPIEPTCLLLHQGLNHHTSGLKVLHSSLIIFSRGISFLSENLSQCLYPVPHRNNIEIRYEDESHQAMQSKLLGHHQLVTRAMLLRHTNTPATGLTAIFRER